MLPGTDLHLTWPSMPPPMHSDCEMTPAGGMAALAARAMAANVPLQVQLELTGRCHMDCVHCYLDVKRPPRDELTCDEVVRVLDELAAAGSMMLTLTGGEIFLRDDVLDIVAAARRRHFAVRLFTSGTLLNRELVARIAELRPAAVEISIYGLHHRAHDSVTRRPGSLRKSLRAAVLLRRAGVPVVLKSPMIDGTGDAHFDLIDAARRIGAGYSIDPTLMSRRDGGVEPLEVRPDPESVTRLFADSRLVPEHTDAHLPGPTPTSEAPCAIARRVVRIAPNGDVHACSAFPIPAGNVREASFAEIWQHSPVLEKIRAISVGDLEGACRGCGRSGYCGRCSARRELAGLVPAASLTRHRAR